MSISHHLLHVLPQSVEFVDYSKVAWEQVRRTQYWIYQRFRYQYPGPIQDLHQRLIVVPPQQHGDQTLRGHKLRVTTSDVFVRYDRDEFGNTLYFLHLPHVAANVDFEVWSSVERDGLTGTRPLVGPDLAARLLEPGPLTRPNAALHEIAHDLTASDDVRDPWVLADRINDWVWQRMRYTSGATTVATTAAEALALSAGLCQDYSHIMIALCRLVGLPARYVSGHLLGEGGSHAWVEVLLPDPAGSSNLVAVAYDPTNHCRAGLRHITIAVGQDFQDVSPTSGYFTAPYSGQLTTSKRAGLIEVETHDGLLTSVPPPRMITPAAQRRIA